jgi:hypothetical protein
MIHGLAIFFYSSVFASNIVDLGAKNCQHGLNQPPGGDFAVFVFCDDAIGTQLGVIYQKRGVGPVEDKTDWSNANRFWQEGPWMIDVTQLVWSDSGNFLYLTTSPLYSDGSFYELDLRHRKATKLLGQESGQPLIRIERVEGGKLWVSGVSFPMRN